MLLVVDANVVFSALVKRGNSFEVFEKNRLFKKFDFIAPEFMFTELENKRERLKEETKLSEKEIEDVLSLIKDQITSISSSDFTDKLPEAFALNFKDAPYLALALKMNCPVFSGDKGLKEQTKVRVLSPRELLNMFN